MGRSLSPTELTLDFDNLARFNGIDVLDASRYVRQQIFQTICLRAKNDNYDISAG